MTKRVRHRLIKVAVALAVSLLTYWLQTQPQLLQQVKVQNDVPAGYYRVTEFVDGDTFAVDMAGTAERVRLIGVDTPETHKPDSPVQCFGQAASTYTKQLIGENAVRLEVDPTNSNRDRYNRLLRYAYLPDGRLINAEIIKNGYGFAYVSFPFQKMDEFTMYQAKAREANKGLWSGCEVKTISGNRMQTNDEAAP